MRSRFGLRRLLGATALAAAALALLPIVSEAILVSPHAVFIDARTRTAQVILHNTGTSPEEVSLELRYGYPDTDSAGNIFVRLVERPDSSQPSAAGWIRAFPQRAVVRPGERQVVRLLAQPPVGLPEGEYWTRLIVTSRGAQVAIGAPDTVVQAGVSLVVSTIISVTFRNGALRTGVAVRDFRVEPRQDTLVAWLGVAREGNAAFLGTAWVRLRNAAGQVVRQWDTPLGVYFELRRRFVWPLEGLAPGRYTAELEITTAREDIPRNQVLPAEPVRLMAAALALSGFGVREAAGQAAQALATADISTTALSIGSQLNLAFGAVTPGVPTTIDPRTNAGAGQFVIHGAKNAEVAISMTLPTELSTGFWTMPISFGATGGCWRKGPGQAGCAYWDPSTVLIQRIRNQNPPNNHLYVWIGGAVSPSAVQHTGTYLATITLSVVYTGN